MNGTGKNASISANSVPRYWLIGKDGIVHSGIFLSAREAEETAARLWPDQEQDPDRTGKGWDISVVGAK